MKRIFLMVVAVVMVVALIGGAVGGVKAATPPKLEPIKIGALTSLSGPFVVWGAPIVRGMRLAVKELNEAGGVIGREVVLLERDTRGSPDEGITLMRGFVERERVVAVGGVVSSGVGMATSRMAEELRVPILLVFSGSHQILKKDSRFTFRTNLVAGPMLIDAFATFIQEKGIKRVGVIIADYAWGHAIKDAIERKIVPLPGIKVQIEVAPVRETDFTTYLRRLERLNPEILILTGHPPGQYGAAKQAFEMGIGQYTTHSGGGEEVFMDVIGKPGFGHIIEFSSADWEDPAYQDLAERYHRAFGCLFGSSAFAGYVDVMLVADAIKRTNSVDPKDIADAIRTGRFVKPGYAFPLSYTEWGELKEASYVLFTLEAGDPGRINPGADWRPKVLFRSPQLKAFVPKN
jgi:branched-chain amino acid transport system substrate-binding protein